MKKILLITSLILLCIGTYLMLIPKKGTEPSVSSNSSVICENTIHGFSFEYPSGYFLYNNLDNTGPYKTDDGCSGDHIRISKNKYPSRPEENVTFDIYAKSKKPANTLACDIAVKQKCSMDNEAYYISVSESEYVKVTGTDMEKTAMIAKSITY